ncbi:hypothetical protein [uncultured Streptomyces sp.]|uniref:hypothetical protein n=1 Tax=uncultured Streptomyces sp. TaxID=174707 RepID=UPI00262FBFDE|nr:hypothetical protein [uncultured Streptomyces sp.]
MSQTPSPVRSTWTRIDRRLRVHASHSSSHRPPIRGRCEQAQWAMGMRFPDDLLESPARHDGIEEELAFPGRPPRLLFAPPPVRPWTRLPPDAHARAAGQLSVGGLRAA